MARSGASERLRRAAKDFVPPIALRATRRLRGTKVSAPRTRAGVRETGNPEFGADWYDNAFDDSGDHIRGPYWKYNFYGALTLVTERISRMDDPRVLDVGCGAGGLAEMLYDRGIKDYTGFDFSASRLGFARSRVPAYRFEVDDAYTTDLFDTVDYTVVVSTEFMEHVEGDLEVLGRIRPGTRVICTVPDHGHTSHVRFFLNETAVVDRYGPFLADCRVDRVRNVTGTSVFVFDGIRLPPAT